MMTERGDEPDAGAHGDALHLISAVQDWAARTFPPAGEGHTGCEYQWCPICQIIGVLRGERPDVNERVAEAGTALMSAFRAFVDATKPATDDAAGTTGAGGSAPPRVQRIDLNGEDATPEDTSADPSAEA